MVHLKLIMPLSFIVFVAVGTFALCLAALHLPDEEDPDRL